MFQYLVKDRQAEKCDSVIFIKIYQASVWPKSDFKHACNVKNVGKLKKSNQYRNIYVRIWTESFKRENIIIHLKPTKT